MHVERGRLALDNKNDPPIKKELQEIQEYIVKEFNRIDKQYTGNNNKILKRKVAHRVALMVSDIDYKQLSIKTLDQLFSQFDMTFKKAMDLLEGDYDKKRIALFG
ncbi:hypothetical protein GRF59_26735 [Paenibacillus sp. HJL G12]|uniref:Uncharacterized protein n=1 Tax=Paenibacillus dendrobii TaxID=2691084 RepID=A0A7X3LKE7_9BACL|nr:hypothetical protein [Paenibacillus dendrobii]MWV47195.1 hypothetical protein [Paenibacillus dendrobii]